MPNLLIQFMKRLNKKRILYFALTIWTVIIPVCLVIFWIGYDKGRKSIQLVTIPVNRFDVVSKKGMINDTKKKFVINLKGE